MPTICSTSLLVIIVAAAVNGVTWAQPPDTGKPEGLAAWRKISDVLTHPRCLNCHQLNTPLQGDRRRVHVPPVVRGADGMGNGTMRCHNCHNDSGNNPLSGVPGASHWQLAPVSMLWEGLSTGGLCRMLRDPSRNGHRTPEALVEHVETEHLVLWGWNPGGHREPVPLPHKEFVEQMRIWVAALTPCPP
jgi:hypothetical protein